MAAVAVAAVARVAEGAAAAWASSAAEAVLAQPGAAAVRVAALRATAPPDAVQHGGWTASALAVLVRQAQAVAKVAVASASISWRPADLTPVVAAVGAAAPGYRQPTKPSSSATTVQNKKLARAGGCGSGAARGRLFAVALGAPAMHALSHQGHHSRLTACDCTVVLCVPACAYANRISTFPFP